MLDSNAVARAYQDVFGAHTESSKIVLADLAEFSGFYTAPPMGTPNEDLQYVSGARAVFQRIFLFLSQTAEGVDALDEAARKG